MEKTIHVTIRSVYGRDNVYPACEMSRLLCDLAGSKTLTESMRSTLVRQHGWAIIIDSRV